MFRFAILALLANLVMLRAAINPALCGPPRYSPLGPLVVANQFLTVRSLAPVQRTTVLTA
jgi:hypothetical protein